MHKLQTPGEVKSYSTPAKTIPAPPAPSSGRGKGSDQQAPTQAPAPTTPEK